MTSTEVDVTSGEIVALNAALDLRFAHSPAQTAEWMRQLQEYRRAILVDGPDFTVIPGTEKPSLLKPGAEKLLLAAGLGFTIMKVDDEDSRTHRGVTYRCTVRRGAQIVAECDGYAGYDESRFYVSAVDAEARERANATQYQRAARAAKFVEYRAPWNSVSKMAQKRGMVGATLNALAASGLFTQDMEDAVAGQVPSFDPLALMKPHLERLDAGQLAELKAWRQANDMPSPSHMSAEQAAAALVEIGRLMVLSTPDPDRDPGVAESAEDEGRPFDAPEGQETLPGAPVSGLGPEDVSQDPEAVTGPQTVPDVGNVDVLAEDNGHRGAIDRHYELHGIDGLLKKLADTPAAAVVKQLVARGVQVSTELDDDGARRLLGSIVIRNATLPKPADQPEEGTD